MYIFIVALGVLTRIVPHMQNVGMITALAIFAGYVLPRKQALVLPLAVRLISDLFLGFFSPMLMVAVYAAHLFGVLLGWWVKQNTSTATRWVKIVSSGFIGALVFFLVTNFALFYSPAAYPHTWKGIMLAYTNGLPFFRGTVLGDVGYTVALFAVYEYALWYSAHKKLVTQSAEV